MKDDGHTGSGDSEGGEIGSSMESVLDDMIAYWFYIVGVVLLLIVRYPMHWGSWEVEFLHTSS